MRNASVFPFSLGGWVWFAVCVIGWTVRLLKTDNSTNGCGKVECLSCSSVSPLLRSTALLCWNVFWRCWPVGSGEILYGMKICFTGKQQMRVQHANKQMSSWWRTVRLLGTGAGFLITHCLLPLQTSYCCLLGIYAFTYSRTIWK